MDPRAGHDRGYQWSSTKVGRVDEEIKGWPVGDKNHLPTVH